MTALFLVIGVIVASAMISYATGSFWLGALPPAIGVGMFAASGAVGNPDWYVGIFLMAALPYGVISCLGASIGATSAKRRKKRESEDFR